MEEILFKLKKIENTIIEIDDKKNQHIISIINNKLSHILNNEIQKLINLKNRDNGRFKSLPNEVLLNIFKFIDIKDLMKIKNVCHLFNDIISEYTRNYISYCFTFYIYENDIYTDNSIIIECEDCKNINNRYINKNDIYKKNIDKCKKCKYKNTYDEPFRLRKVILKYIILNSININMKIIEKNKMYINNIYKNNKINDSKIFIINKEENNVIYRDILNIILTNSYGNLEIYTTKSLDSELFIINPNLNSLLINDNLLLLKLKMHNLKSLQINVINNTNFFNYKIFMDYIFMFSYKIKKLIVENKFLKILNNINFNKNYINTIKTLKIISVSNKNIFMKDLIEFILKNKNIKYIELTHTNDMLLKHLNEIPYLNSIFINKEYITKKYIKKYNKVNFI